MPSKRSLRAQILALAVALLGGVDHGTPKPVTVTIERAGVRVRLRLRRGELAAPSESREALSTVQRAILGTATVSPTPAKQLARKLKRSCNSYFRQALRDLVRAGHLRHTPDGYALPVQT